MAFVGAQLERLAVEEQGVEVGMLVEKCEKGAKNERYIESTALDVGEVGYATSAVVVKRHH